MQNKHNKIYKLFSVFLIIFHFFVFCLKDVSLVFAEEAVQADTAAGEVSGEAPVSSDEEINSQDSSQGAQEGGSGEDPKSEEGGEEPPILDGGDSQSQNNSLSFNSNALQSIQPSLFSGALTYSVPISVPSGRKGIQPNITLLYSSQSGNGILGMGWILDLGSIERSTKDGAPKYDSTDIFIFKSGGSTIELVDIGGNEFRAKIEEAFMKFTYNGSYWIVKDKSGITYYFGQNQSSQQNNGSNVFKWCLDKVQDALGNYMSLTYIKDNGQIYPDMINYTGNDQVQPNLNPAFQVDFDYDDSRLDYFFSYRSKFLIRTNKLLSSVTVKQNGSRIRRYVLSYQYSPSTKRALLVSITQYGLTDLSSLPPIELTYQEKPNTFSDVVSWNNVNYSDSSNWNGTRANGSGGPEFTYVDIFDINRDGLPDRIFRGYNTSEFDRLWAQLNNGASFDNLQAWSYIAAQPGQNDRAAIRNGYSQCNVDTLDIDGDGLFDRIYTQYNGNYNQWEIQINNGSGFNSSTLWTNIYGFNSPSHFSQIFAFASAWEDVGLFDINGDGKPDRVIHDSSSYDHWHVQLNTGSNSFANVIEWPNVQYIPSGGHSSETYIRTAGSDIYFATFDINGDGLPDRIMDHDRWSNYTWYVQYNNGAGFENISEWGPFAYNGDSWSFMFAGSPTYVTTADINGDGLPDKIMRNHNDPYGNWQVHINNGHGFEPIVEWGQIFSNGDYNKAHINAVAGDATYVDFLDINGDGLLDRIIRPDYNSNYWQVQFNQGPHPDLLSTISNGIGGQAQVTYDVYIGHDNTEQADKGNLGFPVNVVTQIQTSDGRGNSYSSAYSYDKGKFDYSEREFRGFGKVTATDVEGNYSISYFHQGDYDKGRIFRQEAYDSSGITQTKSENTWSAQENVYPGFPDVKFIYLSESNSYAYDNGTASRRTKTEQVYGESTQYGNPTEIIAYGEVDVDSGNDIENDKRTTFVEYTYNMADWILSLPARTYTEDINTNKVSEKKFYYGNNLGIFDIPFNGLLTKEEVWLYNSITLTENWLSSQYSYDSYGNLVSATDANNHTSTTTYETTYYIYPLTVSNHLGHTLTTQYYGINGVPLDDGNGLKGLFSQVKSAQDPNGVISYSTFDGLGRLEKVIGPNDTIDYPASVSEYDLSVSDPISDPVKVTKRVKAKDNPTSLEYPDYYASYSFVDGMGRLIESKSPAESDPQTGSQRQIISGITEYNLRGMVDKKYLTYFVNSSSSFVQPNYAQPYASFQYDCLGRIVQTTNPDLTYSTVSYGDWQVTATDEEGNYKTHYYDSYQRLIRVDEHNNGQTYTTVYSYDILGNLISVVDNQGNATTIIYDSLGRKIRMIDPDMGTWNYEYDSVGNLTRQIDAASQELTFTYDALNRLTQKTIQATQNVNYEYDDLAKTFCIGRLSKVTYEAGQAEFFYDNLGREIRSVKTVDSIAYSVERSYDPLDRLVTLTYPDTEVVSYTYNPQGIETVTGASTYVANIDYSSTSQITKIQYGNGTTTNYAYDPSTFRLTNLTTNNGQLATIQDLNYTFDNVGNILGIIDNVNSAAQVFEYDNLSRLVSANGTYYGAINYSYDSIGNILTKGALTLNYNNPRPHAVSSYANSQTGQTVNFTYDANGNMSNRTNATTSEQTNYSYDYESHLTKVEQIYPEGSEMEVALHFEPGWNFFSLPLVPADPSVAATFSNLISYETPDSYSKLLLHSDGPDGLASFTDSSTFDHSVLANGDIQIDTAVSKYGGASALFDGEGDYLSSPDSDDWFFGTGDFTIDFWVKFNGFNVNDNMLVSQYAAGGTYFYFDYSHSQQRLYFQFYNGGVAAGEFNCGFAPTAGTWYYLTLVRDGANAKVFVDGASKALSMTTDFGANDVGDCTGRLKIGAYGNDGAETAFINGWIDDMRISKGIARWTENFTPPAPSVAYDQISRYNPATGKFNSYVGDPAFNEFDTLEYGKGYAIYVNNPDGADVTVRGTAPAQQNLSLAAGWNLIPYPYLSQSSVQGGLGNLQFNVDYDLVLSYNQATGEFIQYPGSLANLEPNKSYYLHCLQPSAWNIESLSRTTDFYYDGDGGRVKVRSEIDQAQTTTYIGSLFEKLTTDDGQLTTKKHIYAGANRVCVLTTENQQQTASYYHGDHLGSSNIITDGSGQQIARYEYSPFGEVAHQSGSYTTDIKYTGKIQDDTGLYYYGARYYDPVIGRFITPDTIVQAPSDPQSLNRYAYCRNNPIKYVDPSGRWFWVAVIVGAILGGASAAANNQPIWQGMLMGAAGGLMVGGGAAAFGFWGAVGGGILAGAGNAAATGGNIGFGALAGGLGAGLGYGLGSWASGWESGSFWGELGGSMMAGAVAGGVGAELSGGKFGQGAWMGAAYGSAGFFGSKAVGSLDPRIRQSQARQQEARAKHALNSKKSDMIKIPVGGRSVSSFKLAGHEFLPDFQMGPGPGGKINTTRTIKNLSDWGTHIETQDAIASGTAQFTTAEVSASGLVDAMQWYEQGWVDTNTRYSGGSFNSNYAVNTVIYAAGGNVPNVPGWYPAFGNVPSSVFYPYVYNRDD
jgi:RHS repeat-associated protein